jgi:DNA-binding IclR family transcriptional regulator
LTKTHPQMVQSVTRAVDLLVALEEGPRSLRDLVAETGLSKATAHRLLSSLSYGQFVIQDPSSSDYLLGPGCFGVGDAVIRGYGGLNVIAGSVLEELRDLTQETVTLHVMAGKLRICVGQFSSLRPIRYVAQVGAARPLYLGAMGKVLLAYVSDDVRKEILDRTSLDRVTSTTIVDRQRLDEEIERIRSVGYAISRGENVVGAVAISVPVFNASGHMMAALSILGPDDRLTDLRLKELLPDLLDTSRAITRMADPVAGQNVEPAISAVEDSRRS